LEASATRCAGTGSEVDRIIGAERAAWISVRRYPGTAQRVAGKIADASRITFNPLFHIVSSVAVADRRNRRER
jgi:hypothetical protein